MTRSELAAYPPLLLCLAVALSGNPLGLVGVGVLLALVALGGDR